MTARVALTLALILPCLPGVAHARRPKPAASDDAQTPEAQPQAQWYYAIDGRTVGPINDETFVDAYLLGRVTDATAVWWEGAQDWMPLAKAPWFVELDRWYVRDGTKGLGPMTGVALRASLAKAQSQGKAIAALEVRLEWSRWLPVAEAAPLHAALPPLGWEPDASQIAAPAGTLASTATPSTATPSTATPSTATPMPVRDVEDPIASEPEHDALSGAMRLRKSGLITLIVGTGLVTLGGGIAGGYTTGAVGAKGLWAGVGIFAVGLVPTIAGAAMFAAGNRRAARLRRLATLRFAPLAGRGHGGVVVGGRF